MPPERRPVYAIRRPAVLFDKKGILVNNIVWLLRYFPIFGVFGRGAYCFIPIYVDDLAGLAVEQASKAENIILDAIIGPEVYTYRELVQTIGRIIGRRRPIMPVPPFAGWLAE